MDGKEHKSQLQLFEGRKIRTVWDEEAQEWFFPLGEAFEEISAGILENFGFYNVNP